MPLRDHFHPPIHPKSSWEALHGFWPATVVQRLFPHLPGDFVAEPRVHLGALYEIDVCAFEDHAPRPVPFVQNNGGAGTATAVWTATEPTLLVDTDVAEQYEYEVLVFNEASGKQLVAAVEFVSPANKDRGENRRAFATKCAALIQQGVCVTIVDLVTTRSFNLYAETLELIGQSDPGFLNKSPGTYAVTYRGRRVEGSHKTRTRFEAWAQALVIGQALPTLPLWLSDEVAVPLELELSYEDACRVLRIA